MAISLAGGSPPGNRWPSAGYPPLRSLRLGDRSPDVEYVTQLQKDLHERKILDPVAGLTDTQRDDLRRLLDRHFGTPLNPTVHVSELAEVVTRRVFDPEPDKGVFANLGLIAGRLKERSKGKEPAELRELWTAASTAATELGLKDESLARGGVLYRRWCLHCHGPTGAGDGEQAVRAAAMPRDYRQGVFKFVTADPASTKRGVKGKPRKDDLKRVVRSGIDGSMMPPFAQFTDAELDDLTGYVIHLSARGETEFRVMAELLKPAGDYADATGWLIDQLLAGKVLLDVMEAWGIAQEPEARIEVPPEETPTPDDRLDSAIRGYQVFQTSGCVSCHVDYGRAPKLMFDAWGTVVQPRNFVLGVYRGGRRGEDLYARIHGGIVPATMPSFNREQLAKAARPGKPDAIWDIVHFLQALGDPQLRRAIQDPKALRKARERDPDDPTLKAIEVVRIEP